MIEFENNAHFWQKLDTIYLSSDFVATKHKGEKHSTYPDLTYPCTYGFLKTLSNEKDNAIACFKGSASKVLDTIIVSADILEKKLEVVLLVGCTDEEQIQILNFLNQTDLQKTIIIHRTNYVPNWGVTED